ncbi:NADPH-dependent oxidoreductase [Lacticaseibacillus mingshuiensis]|uniref:NADPH-dependent oxidoreductase n=1 Tax=Lacticaseibacillus mingshuiensis TaxID=2799574 RepID=A0ABW4CJ88_9LACO|nr:NADPH-dependent oxidoreductase [Lacticaseibacillus mingshuiensis]
MVIFDSRLSNQLHHRTIRRFLPEPVNPEAIDALVAVAQHTATSHFLQSFSMISITDPELRRQIATIAKQDYVAGNGHLFIFIADQHRAWQIAQRAGVTETHLGSADKFLQATSDALLAAQNVVNAAENLGLGTVLLGSILNDPLQLIRLLQLPRLTFPVIGLIVGEPDQAPQFKPRLAPALVHFDNRYQLPADAAAQVTDYDAVIRDYYATRDTNQRAETFSHLISGSSQVLPAHRGDLKAALSQQGFFAE